MNFWDIVWTFFWTFAFISYLFAMFAVIGDIFRDRNLGGGLKALWILFLIFVPFLTVLVYLIARGGSMAERSAQAGMAARNEADAYIRSVAATSPVDEIVKAKSLLDSGAISQAEFEAIKSRSIAVSV